MVEKIVNLVRKENYMSWDTYFMSIAVLSSFRSKDMHTQNGACVAGEDKKVIGIGYNGLPRGIDDKNDKYWSDNDEDFEYSRHTYVVHAEKNAIYNSITSNLKGASIYVTQFPCNVCAQALIQVGIKKVVYFNRKENTDVHKKRNKCVEDMFIETNIECLAFEDLNISDKKFIEKLIKINKEFYN